MPDDFLGVRIGALDSKACPCLSVYALLLLLVVAWGPPWLWGFGWFWRWGGHYWRHWHWAISGLLKRSLGVNTIKGFGAGGQGLLKAPTCQVAFQTSFVRAKLIHSVAGLPYVCIVWLTSQNQGTPSPESLPWHNSLTKNDKFEDYFDEPFLLGW